jgi:RHS repeat-associated protein
MLESSNASSGFSPSSKTAIWQSEWIDTLWGQLVSGTYNGVGSVVTSGDVTQSEARLKSDLDALEQMLGTEGGSVGQSLSTVKSYALSSGTRPGIDPLTGSLPAARSLADVMRYVYEQGLPDLVAEVGSSTLAAIATSGEAGQLAVTLRNQGGLKTKTPVTVKVFASLKAALDAQAIEIGQYSLNSLTLKANQSTQVSVQVKLPETLQSGAYNLFVAIDTAGNLREANTANNIAVASQPQVVVAKPGQLKAATSPTIASTSPSSQPASSAHSCALPFAIVAEGQVSVNGGGDFDGDPLLPDDDALIYGGRGLTLNGKPVLPVQRDGNGNPILDSQGRQKLIDHAVAVSSNYSVFNAPTNQYGGLVPTPIVATQTVNVPSHNALVTSTLEQLTPVGAVPVTFNVVNKRLNNSSEWASNFPAGGTAANPKVIRITGGGLTIPSQVTLANTILLVENGDINFNGSGHQLNNVTLVTYNGGINLSNAASNNLTVLSSRQINMNGSAVFGGRSLLASQNSVTFNGATTAATDRLKVVSQGDITFNGKSGTRAQFLAAGNFTFNGNSTLIGRINAKGNITFNGRANVMSSSDAPIVGANKTIVVAEDSGATPLGIGLPSDPDGDLLTIRVSALPDATKGSIRLANGTALTAQQSLTLSELQGLTFVSAANANGEAGNFSYVADDGWCQLSRQTVAIQITPVNDAPVIVAPSALTLAEDTSLSFLSGLQIQDVDAGTLPLQITLAVGHGRLQLGSASETRLVLTGLLSELNTKLAQLRYQPDANYVGSDALSISVNDQGNTGAGGALNASKTIALTITAVNDAPVLVGPALVTVAEDSSQLISGLQVSDIDAGSSEISVRLVVGQGILQLAQRTGLSGQTGNAEGASELLFRGTVAAVNTALNSLSYRGAANYAGADSLKFEVSDLGNTGTGGALSASKTIALTITAVNDAPVIIAPNALTLAEDTSLLLSGLQIQDVDAGTLPLQVTLAVGQGRLQLGSASENRLVLTGSLSEVNTKLSQLRYQPDANYVGSDALSISVNDQGNTGAGGALSASKTIDLTITAVNDAPILSGPASVAVTEDASQLILGLQVSDIDAGGSEISVRLLVGQGTLQLAQRAGLSGQTGNVEGASELLFRGTVAAVNTALGSLSYRGAANYAGADSLRFEVSDLGNTGAGGALSASKTIALTITAINDAPLLIAPSVIASIEAGQYLPVTGIAISDVDAASGQMVMTLTAGHGALRLNSAGVTVTAGNAIAGSSTLTLSGSLSALNTALGTLVYKSDERFSGTETISLTVDDQGNTGAGGALSDRATITLQVTEVTPTGIVLKEGNHFSVFAQELLTIPATPTVLQFSYAEVFDRSDLFDINDAFEVALLDAAGHSLVHTFATGKDAFFNLSEGLPVAQAAGVKVVGKTVSLDLSDIPAGTAARLVFRLVNNDDDTATTVNVQGIALLPGENNGILSATLTPAPTVPTTQINFDKLEDVSGWLTADYGRSSFNEQTKQLSVEVAALNQSLYEVRDSLLMVIENISAPGVRLLNADGVTPDGRAYFRLSHLLGDNVLAGGEMSAFRQLLFRNPDGVQFDYKVSFLSELNVAPEFVSAAKQEALVGKPYLYDADATDTDGDRLRYSLLSGPQGLTVNRETGEVLWNPAASDVGTTQVTLQVEDGHGGVDEQTYTLSVKTAVPNRPPVITTTPMVDATVLGEYVYDVNAEDADQDVLVYSLEKAPVGMRIDPTTGIIHWQPSVSQLGVHTVEVKTADGRGGVATQKYDISVSAVSGNSAPIIISEPKTQVFSVADYRYQVKALDPEGDEMVYSLLSAPEQMVINAVTGEVFLPAGAAAAGNYEILIQVADSFGNKDTQKFNLNVSSQLPGQIWGRVYDENSGLTRKLTQTLNTVSSISNQSNYLPSTSLPVDQIAILPVGFDSLLNQFGYHYPSESNLIFNSLVAQNTLTSGIYKIGPDGSLERFSPEHENNAYWPFAIVPENNLGGFTDGDVYTVPRSNGGLRDIGYITNGGETVVENFASLPYDKTWIADSFVFDETGVFGGDLIVYSSRAISGTRFVFVDKLWRINSTGEISELATFDSTVSDNIEIVPNNPKVYGPLAGKIVLPAISNIGGTADVRFLYTVDVNGVVEEVPIPQRNLRSIQLIRPNENLFFADNAGKSTPQTWNVVSADYFQSMAGDFLVEDQYSQLHRMYWDGEALQMERLYVGDWLSAHGFSPAEGGNTSAVKQGSLVDWLVYVDADNDGQRDADEQYTTTDANGIYSFTLSSGDYTIRQELPTGWSQVEPVAAGYEIFLASGQTITGVNFGNIQNSAPTITSVPNKQAFTAEDYQYQVKAVDPDENTLTYALISAPAGMVIDSQKGLVTWSTANIPVGTYSASLRVTDTGGLETVQSFDIEVSNALPGQIWGRVFDDNSGMQRNLEKPVLGAVTSAATARLDRELPNPETTTRFPAGVFTYVYGNLEYSEVNETLLLSRARLNSQEPLATSILSFIQDDGTLTPATNSAINTRMFAPGTSRPFESMAIADKDNLGGFNPGDIFGGVFHPLDTSGGQVIYKISSDGETIIENWATLPEAMRLVAPIVKFDQFGTFGGDLIAYTESSSYIPPKGEIFRIKADGSVTHLASIEGSFRANVFEIIPNDIDRYGPLAGKIIVSAQKNNVDSIFTIDVEGNVETVLTDAAKGRAYFYLVPSNENLFFTTTETNYRESDSLFSISADDLQPFAGDILVRGEGGLSRMYWDGSAFQYENILREERFSFRSLTFAPVGMGEIADVKQGSLTDWLVYVDADNDGQRDADELYTTTDKNGIYSFTLPGGDYKIRQELLPGWSQTKPTTQSYEVVLASGQTITGVNFGNIYTAPPVEVPKNHEPDFVSFAPTQARVGQKTLYRAKAEDLDGDTLAYELSLRPDGMVIDDKTGIVAWRPTSAQVGSHNVIVKVSDGKGGLDLQAFTLEVGAERTNPNFMSKIDPSISAGVNVLYQYQFNARTPALDPITYSLETNAQGVSLDGTTGLFKWIPTAAGTYDFTIVATDNQGGSARQTFQLTSVANLANDAPVILSQAPKLSALGLPYVHGVEAKDPNRDPLSYGLVSAPSGMSIDEKGSIFWQPTPAQVGNHTFSVNVSDGRGGVATQTVDLKIVSSATIPNQAPSIDSTPITSATLGQTYRYEVVLSDPNNDQLLLTLEKAPQGMFLDPLTSSLYWTPTSGQQGEYEVVLNVIDSKGASDTQTFTVTARTVNLPPRITSVPPTEAVLGKTYQYALQAKDLESTQLSYRLATAPAGMQIDPATGQITWTPSNQQSLGAREVSIIVADGEGKEATQTYQLNVVAVAANQAPVILSTPQLYATAGATYRYLVSGADPEGAALTYRLLSGPTGMAIDASTGELTWQPGAGENGQYSVEVSAVDPTGLGGAQRFTLKVVAGNDAPVILSAPKLTALIGEVYSYDVRSQDPNGDRLSYSLSSAPSGMTIDAYGRIRWTPATAGNTEVEVLVSDSYGATTTQRYTLTTTVDTLAPVVSVQPSVVPAEVNQPLAVYVSATDNVGVVNRTLTINGTAVALNNGVYQFTPTVTGNFSAIATATDAAGNTSQAQTVLEVRDFSTSGTAPTVALLPLAGRTLTSATDIFGSVQDDNLVAYTLSLATLGSNNFREIYRSATTVNNAKLGVLDTSLFQNDAYTLRLTAEDGNGNVVFVDETVNIGGNLKLGNFTLSFNDMELPVSGIPVTVTRTYDSLNASTTDDFGYGWRLEFRDTDLRTSLGRDEQYEEYGIRSLAFDDKTKVYITLPGGQRQGFTFAPKRQYISNFFPAVGGADPSLYKAAFKADAGVTSTLSVRDSSYLSRRSDGGFIGLQGSGFNPEDSLFGSVYVLTTKEGIEYEIDAASGDLLKAKDLNGNTVTFSDSGIYSDNGSQITFGRDAQGRITSVIDPLGAKVQYAYDAKGDLVSVTDRVGSTTRLEYNDTFAHYLDEVIDPLGRSGVKSEYDAQGRLKRMLDVNGEAVELVYDPANSQQTVKDVLGNPTTYVYDARGNVVTKVDALGGITQRTYDQNNNLLSITNAEGEITTYTYDEKGNKLTETDALDNTSFSAYNSFGKALSITDAQGKTTTFSYDSKGNQTSIGIGNTIIKNNLNGRGRVNEIVGADGSKTAFFYNNLGQVTEQIDTLGNKTEFGYDAAGNLLTETKFVTVNGILQPFTTQWTYDQENRVTSTTDAAGQTTQYQLDKLGNITESVDPLGRRTQYQYNDKGLLTKTLYADGTFETTAYDPSGRESAKTNRLGFTTQFIYDALGRLTQTILPDSTPNNLADNARVSTEYDKVGRRLAEIDARGNRTEFDYDGAGRLVMTRDALGNKTLNTVNEVDYLTDRTDALGRTTHHVFDELGREIKTQFADGSSVSYTYNQAGLRDSFTDQEGHTTYTIWDVLGRPLQTILPDATPNDLTDNPVIRQEYDELSRLTAEIDASGLRTEYAYDVAGRLMTISDGRGTTRYTYDAIGNKLTETDALGHTTRYRYDNFNRMVEMRYADGTHSQVTYDAVGQVIAKTDQAGKVTRYEYDAQNRLTAVVDSLNQRTKYEYDLAGNLTGVVDANGGETHHQYDALNRRTLTILPLGQQSAISYDAVGNVLSNTDFNGKRISHEYDLLNRLSANRFQDSSQDTLFTYTLDGQIAKSVNQQGQTTYTYDAQNRMLSKTDSNGQFIHYAYDIVGNLTHLTTAHNTTTYSYDPFHRLAQVSDSTGQTTRYSHDSVDNLIRKDLPNGVVETREYDVLNRLTSLEQAKSGVVISGYDYLFDAVGNRTAIQEANGRQTSYTYDDLYRVISETVTDALSGQVTTAYGYDAIGNRLSQTHSGEGVTTYSYDGNSRLLAENHAGNVTQYTYDNNGNVLSKVSAAQTSAYQWNDKHELVSANTVEGAETQQVFYKYNADGTRASQTVDGVETRYLVDTNRSYAAVVEEQSAGGVPSVSYTHGDRRYDHGHDLISQLRDGKTTFYHGDGLGSTRILTDFSGVVTDSYLYDAYGKLLSSVGETVNNYLYTGEQFDSALGEYYLRARYYDPSSGRFTSRDPFEGILTDPLSLAKYPYTQGNPVNATDPSGLFAQFDTIAANIIFDILNAIPAVTPVAAYQAAVAVDSFVVAYSLKLLIATGITSKLAVQEISKQYKIPVVVYLGGNLEEHAQHILDTQMGVGNTFERVKHYDKNTQALLRGSYISDDIAPFHGLSPDFYVPVKAKVPNDRDLWLDQALKSDASLGSRDEFPFATTTNGGKLGYDSNRVSVRYVSSTESNRQGGLMRRFYAHPSVNLQGDNPVLGRFGVVGIPSLALQSGFITRDGEWIQVGNPPV